MRDQQFDNIHTNLMEAGFVYRPEEYIYRRAKDYFTNEKGLIKVFKIE